MKAVRLGLKPEEFITRLTRHSSNELPANVLREVKEWSSWVRQVTLCTMTVVRCGRSRHRRSSDGRAQAPRRTAHRHADRHRSRETHPQEREKLLAQGIIVQTDSDARDELDKELAASRANSSIVAGDRPTVSQNSSRTEMRSPTVPAPFADSPEFQRLLIGSNRVDLARIALEIGRDAYP